MSLNTRQRDLAHMLLGLKEPITVKQLAQRLHVSSRTVRYDLASLEPWLREKGVSLVCKPRVGIFLDVNPSCRAALLEQLQPMVAYDCSLSAQERQQYLLAALLQAGEPLTAEELAEKLLISRATVSADLKRVRVWLTKRGVSLESKPNVGYRVSAPEINWRRAVCDLLAECSGDERLMQLLSEISQGRKPRQGEEKSVVNEVLSLFGKMDLAGLESIVQQVCKGNDLSLNDRAVVALVTHLALALTRLKQGRPISMPHDQLEQLEQIPEFQVAQEMAARVQTVYGVALPLAETGYITLHLMGARMRSPVSGTVNAPSEELGSLVGEFTCAVESLLGVRLTNDQTLLDGLVVHLGPVRSRLKFSLPFRNPLLLEIKEKLAFVFFITKQAASVFARAWGKEMPEEEIGYLTLHVGAALERQRLRSRTRPRTLVVCGSGVGTSQLLASMISSRVPEIQILNFSSVFDLADKVKALRPDLIISTVPLEKCGVQTVVLSSIPTDEEIQELRVTLGFDAGASKKPARHPASGGKKPVLSDVLVPETIRLDAEAESWEESVRLAGELLVASGAVERRYVDSMVKAVRELGPYIVIAPGIAMPHARPEDGVLRIGLSLVRLKTPVPFGNQSNDPVELVIGLSAVDSESHLKLLAQLSKLLNDTDYLRTIREAICKEEVLALIAEVSANS